MLAAMKRAVPLIFLAVSPIVIADPVTITAEQWARPRSGAFVAQELSLAPLIEALDLQPDGALIVQHARSDDGSIWAEELRAWLVALGVPSAQVVLVPRSGFEGRVTIDVRGYREQR